MKREAERLVGELRSKQAWKRERENLPGDPTTDVMSVDGHQRCQWICVDMWREKVGVPHSWNVTQAVQPKHCLS